MIKGRFTNFADMLRKLVVAALLLCSINSIAQESAAKKGGKEQPKIDYRDMDSPMPTMKLVTLDTLSKLLSGNKLEKANKKSIKEFGYPSVTRIVTEDDLTHRGNTIVMMFNPTCGHCEDQCEFFKKNLSSFNKTRIIMMTRADMKTYLPDFVKNHKTADYYPMITVGLDSAEFVKETFQYGALPQINIYSHSHRLLKTYNGEAKMDSLEQYID